ncbi:hypothetical protein EYF80_040200 [Liparis tanakae]|uniref:Uncharacterized protein n=1 Tax=Liparis tanakae TaxID=230148 RepID=A0A4Z2GAI9_9TELE|nr:hypothetical protein EYF80_040200 [Liparis tanakae]
MLGSGPRDISCRARAQVRNTNTIGDQSRDSWAAEGARRQCTVLNLQERTGGASEVYGIDFPECSAVLQVGVEEVCVRQRDLQQRFDDVADGAVVRESDLLGRADEITQTETKGRVSADKACLHITGSHFETYYLSNILSDPPEAWMWSQKLPTKDGGRLTDPLDGMIQTGPAQVDILAVVVGGEQPQQAGQDDVVIIIHVAEPPTTHTLDLSDRHTAILVPSDLLTHFF